MRPLSFPHQPPRTVLCIGAHADDIEIGCGGTLMALREASSTMHVHWAVLSAPGDRTAEARRGAELFVGSGPHELDIGSFRDGYFPAEWAEIKDWFGTLADRVAPDLIFTHAREDRHQDHRVVSDLTWNHFRNHLVLEYEVPKFDGDLGRPNVFVPLTRSGLDSKIANLEKAFTSQASKPWFNRETFRGLAALRGNECRAPEGFAEAFVARKVTLEL